MITDKEMIEGVYFHEKKGFAVVYRKGDGYTWVVDKNKRMKHLLFNFKFHIVEELTGKYFFNKSLKSYEYIGEF